MDSSAINYVRKVLVVKDVHDGDTFRFLIDQGVGDARDLWVRLQGIDTWELSDPLGIQARDTVAAFFSSAKEIIIQTFKRKSGEDVVTFIRYVADVYVDGLSLSLWLRANHPELIKVV